MPDPSPIYGEDHPSRQLLELIGDKWTPIVISILGQGTRRYGELQRQQPDVAKKMLTQTLRARERAGRGGTCREPIRPATTLKPDGQRL
jgi:DNA-binding HxlR family transcriptional regulator